MISVFFRKAIRILLLLFSIHLSAESFYYSSDESAFIGVKVADVGSAKFVLELGSHGERSFKILYHDGHEEERWITEPLKTGTKVTHLVNGILRDESDLLTNGAIVEERIFAMNENTKSINMIEKKTFTYKENRISKIKDLDATEKQIGSMEYRYDPKGRLIDITATGSLGNDEMGIIPGSTTPLYSWSTASKNKNTILVITSFNSYGLPIENDTYKDNILFIKEILIYASDGRLTGRIQENPVQKTLIKIEFDMHGRIFKKTSDGNEGEKTIEYYNYYDDSSIREWSIITKEQTTLKTYTYHQGDNISIETTTINGILVSIIAINHDGSEHKDLYDNGVLFAKVVSIGGRIKKESFFVDGTIVRTKEYP